ncbi:MAG: hypothetical protein Q8R02_22160 [Hyphomonadaceae bacterium]|nr:hypothetical protein [Hyphomonadaceae bacterium]
MAQSAKYPDLQGYWVTAYITPLERPPEVSKLVLTPSEGRALFEILWNQRDARDPLGPLESVDVRSLVNVQGQIRSSLIVDPGNGKLPLKEGVFKPPPPVPFTRLDDPEQRPPSERCIPRMSVIAPMLVAPAGNVRQFVLTADHLVIQTEAFNQTRIVPLRSGAPGRHETGVGHWEGETLVVESSAFAPGERARVGPYAMFPISPDTRIVERFRRVSDGEMLYSFTVEDPAFYTRAWTAEMSLYRTDKPAYEWACHEGNYAMTNMLRGARLQELRAALRR